MSGEKAPVGPRTASGWWYVGGVASVLVLAGGGVVGLWLVVKALAPSGTNSSGPSQVAILAVAAAAVVSLWAWVARLVASALVAREDALARIVEVEAKLEISRLNVLVQLFHSAGKGSLASESLKEAFEALNSADSVDLATKTIARALQESLDALRKRIEDISSAQVRADPANKL